MTQARRKGMTYLRLRIDSLACEPEADLEDSAAAVSAISWSSRSACSVERERRSEARAASFLPRRKSQRGDSATAKLPKVKKMPGSNETQRMLRHAVFLKA